MGKRTSVFTRYGRKEIILRRYGSMTNFYAVARPFLEGTVKTPQLLANILSNEPCTPEQASAVEEAVEYHVDNIERIMDRMLKQAERGKIVHKLQVSEVVALRASLRLDPELPPKDS